ncbi:MAG: DEAD/DEAH box helicase family protein [Chloroflexi bacterium]|nr:DEAD/DEAH box helicase family protein [Chloroflexota bacterium]
MLRTDPLYRSHFAEVWPWSQWMGRDGVDIGIDIVARRRDGGLAAIQCKCQDRIDKHHIDSFLSESQRRPTGEPYVERYIFTTATEWSDNAARALSSIDPPVQRVDLVGLDGMAIDWDAFLQDEFDPLSIRPRKQLRPHQTRAVNDAISGFETSDRGKLVMACGTGKTLTALRIAERVAGSGGRVLFAAPSLSLLAQSIREWGADAEETLRVFAVCSDTKVGMGDGDSTRIYDMPIPATTDAKVLLDTAKPDAPGFLTVVFTTYQSMQVIADAQDFGLPAFDLVVCDEAHRTTGAHRAGEGSSFLLVHDDEAVHAAKRLYMTATPRVYAESAQLRAKEDDIFVASMDNVTQYGPEFHRLSFAEAVEADLLSDYKVTILAMSEKQIARDHQRLLAEGEALADVGRVIGCLNGLAKVDPEGSEFKDDPEPMRRAVAFSNTIRYSQHFVSLVEREQDEAALAVRRLAIEGKHVDGKSGVLERDRLLAWLRDETAEDRNCHVLSNARCLTEGIDVPALDAVLFLQPRKSQIDVVQAVGRVMRKAEGKRYGYVILPVVVPSGDDPESALDRNDAYSHVWQVLQALRSHDERFDAYINKLDLNKSADGPISVIGVGTNGDDGDSVDVSDEANAQITQGLLEFDLGEFRSAIVAQIVKRCGERRYWERWADSVTDIARRHDERIRALIDLPDSPVATRFDEFVAALRRNLNDSVSRDHAAAMLSQHLVTKPVFDALFGGHEFAERNPVSRVMQRMIAELEGFGLEAETAELEEFYASVRRRVEGIDNAHGKQRVIVELYERFFKVAYPKVAESLGIVYTPVEIVDFIVRSVQELLRREFDAALSDEGVHILDPFVGTGTFITRLLQSGLLDRSTLLHKYATELHANEIMLLAYYIAAVNIETANVELAGEYRPFDGIVLTDTFQASEASDRADTTFFPRNSDRIERQLALDIRVIISNPPWSRGQASHEDDNANQAYPTIDEKISRSYIAQSETKGLKNPLYDSYVRAIRWASDRVQEGDGGIIGFVTNSGFLDGKSFDGFRKVIEREFHFAYVYDLRGNARTSGETRKREGGGVFEQGSRAGVAVLLLVKRPEAVTQPATIEYCDIGDFLTRERKLETVSRAEFGEIEWTNIVPNRQGDWINQRNDHYMTLRPVTIIQSEKSSPSIAPLFKHSSLGAITSRDAWVFNSSYVKLRALIEDQVAFYNDQVRALSAGANSVARDEGRFKWDGSAEQRAKRNQLAEVHYDGFRSAVYRPFFRQHYYMDRILNNSVYQLPKVFPTPETRNPTILVERGLPTPRSSPGILAVDTVPENKANAGAGRACQTLPRYIWVSSTDSGQGELLPAEPHREDNVSDQALEAYRTRYGQWVTKDDIFSYIYGILHSSDYRERYGSDLARMLPRIPEVSTAAAFASFSEAGQQLLDLHIGYEDAVPYSLEERLSSGAPEGSERFRVQKMRWGGASRSPDRSVIVYNDWITLVGIPDEAHDYVVGPRSALEWLLDRYRITSDKASGIVNDPNDWAAEIREPRYIIDLVKRITTVSVETVSIVSALPPLEEG